MGTKFPKASRAVMLMELYATLLATMPVCGFATTVDVAPLTGPATKVTGVLIMTPPINAVTFSFCAAVDLRVAVNTPLVLVVPLAGANVLLVPVADNDTD